MEPVDPKGSTKDVLPAGADPVHDRATDDGPGGPGRAERLPAVLAERYTIRGILGQGAMGAVFRAHDRALDRDVAIKVVRGAGEGADRRSRLAREAQLLAAVRHPGIVAVHDVGETNGTPYVVCELVEGARTLDKAWVGLPLEAKVRHLRDAARALGHAHARGVLHRDVKPENILLDAGGRIRVADFGLATGEDVERLTQTGTCLGTPVYMSPEQFSGGRAPLGPPADVWSLGVCLYEALSGALPFQADTLVGLMQQVALGAYPPPPGPPALRELVRRSLVVDAARRVQDGEAFARALDAWLAPPRAAGRRPAALPALAALGLAAGLAVAWAVTTRAPEAPPAPPAAGEPAPLAPAPTGPPPWFAALPAATRELVPEGVHPTDVEGQYLHGRTHTTLVLVPGGRYVVGPAAVFATFSPNRMEGVAAAEPAREVTLEPLFIGLLEVTVGEFAAFVEATGHRTAPELGRPATLVNLRTGRGAALPEATPAWRLRRSAPVAQRHPVACVTLEDAEAYCGWARLRLPTEEEWEAAARGLPAGGVARTLPWGEEWPTRERPRANHRDARFFEALGQPAPQVPGQEVVDDGFVLEAECGRFPDGAAQCGALDLLGNVAEWVACPDQPELAVFRGGSFITSIDTSLPQRRVEQPRSTYISGEHIGFRVALSAALPSAAEMGR